MAEQRMECTDGKWKGNHLRDIVFGRTLPAYGHRCQLNSHNLDRNQAISTMRCKLMQIFSQIGWPKDSIRNIAFIHHHFCHFSQVKCGIFTWMVPVLAIVAWLKQKKVAAVHGGLSWPVMTCHDFCCGCCGAQKTSTARIILRAGVWPFTCVRRDLSMIARCCKRMLALGCSQSMQSVNMQNNENSMTNDEK
jgi:hypothetical protein